MNKDSRFTINELRKRSRLFLLLSIFFIVFLQIVPSIVSAQLSIPSGADDPTKTGFRIVICDGPTLPPVDPNNPNSQKIHNDLEASKAGANYIPCDFNGMMMQVQHLINIMMVLGTLAAVALFIWAGVLYLTGVQGNIEKARAIFPKVFWGFVIMLVAWFIVYQLIVWLTGGTTFTKLLGTP